jgi:peptide chain release factor subunit 1
MINQSELQKLVDILSENPPILSLYLNVDPAKRSKDEYRLTLRNLLKSVEGQAHPADSERIERYFDFEYDWGGKGVACFSCSNKNLWTPYVLAVPVKDGIFIDRRPKIHPLTELLTHHRPYGVIQIDRNGGRFFAIHLGEIIGRDDYSGEETKKHKQGGWAAQRLQRHDDEQAGHNMRAVADEAEKFITAHELKWIFLAGTDENTSVFRSMLARPYQDLILDSFPLDMEAPILSVLEKSLVSFEDSLSAYQQNLVDKMITAAAKEDTAVLGLNKTLLALAQEKAQILVVSAGYVAPGGVCSDCDSLLAEASESCPYCEGKTMAVEDVVERAMRRMIRLNGQVETISGNPHLDKAGKIGAVLRYR